MNFVKSCFFTALSFGLFLFAQPQALAATLTVPIDHATIQAAINAAAPGDTININNGTYAETLNITKSLTITGQSEAGVIINTPDVNGYAVTVTAVDNVTLQNMTFNRPSAANCTPPNATACYGIKIANSQGHTIQNITIDGSPRTGVDFNGVDNSFITNVTSTNATYGAGISLTDSNNNTVTSVTTSGNSFGGVAVYSSTYYPPAGSTGNVLTGTNSITDTPEVYYEKTNVADPISITVAPDYNFVALSDTPGSEILGIYTNTLAEAITAAENLEISLGNRANSPVLIQEIANPGTTYPDTDPVTAGYQSGDIIAPVFNTLTYIARDVTDTPKGAIGGSFAMGGKGFW
jgi:parallel beta-helix repeat protein